MRYNIEVEMDEFEIINQLRIEIHRFLTEKMIPKKATIKTFEKDRQILSKVTIRKKQK